MPAIAPRLPGGKKTVIILVAVILIISIVGLNIYRSRQQVPLEVVTATAEIEKMGATILASGSIELLEKQEVYAPSDRLVREVPVRVGDQVQKGQIIAILEADSESLSLLDAQARLAEQEAIYQKYFSCSSRYGDR